MMKTSTIRRWVLGGAAVGLAWVGMRGQAPANLQQQLVFAGLRTVAQQGQVNGVQVDAAGNLYLLLNQGDGVRLLKTDNAGSAVLGQALLGAKGDVGVGLALDPAGNVYVAGTTTSAVLTGTAGAAIAARTDASTNSFVAKFDAGLNPLFVTFTGGSRIAAAAVAATADAVFVTGITYAANLPVTANGIQQAPALGSSQNGFVERFSSNGSTLVYATYLTGAAGDTTPAGIAVDAADGAYVVGATSASGFPTIAALVPAMLGNPSGFLTKLSPAGDAIVFSTFVPGAGLTSVALDSAGQELLVAGSVALGQFPVDTVAMPLVAANYQVLLRVGVDGQSVASGTVLAPGSASFVAAAAGGGAWVDGVMTAPMLALTALGDVGNGFAVRVTGAGVVDQTARFGGVPNSNPTFASVPAVLTSVAVDAAGEVVVAGAVQPTASASLLATETYDVPLRNGPTAALPSAVADAGLTAASCGGSLCAGSAAYLAKVDPRTSGAALAFAAGGAPWVVLRNLGSGEADGVQLTTTAGTLTTNCGPTFFAGGQCDVLLAGGGAGTLTMTATNAAAQTVGFGAYQAGGSGIVYFPKELDFGIQTAGSAVKTRTITVSNLGGASQTFVSAVDGAVNPKGGTASPFAEVASDCTLGGVANQKVLGPGGTCHITVGLTAAATDGFLNANWSIGGRDVALTGYSQTTALSVSAAEIDFGTVYTNGVRLPRYLYVTNASSGAVSHKALGLPGGSAFTLTDGCAGVLAAGSVCRVRVDYFSGKSTSTDSMVVTLDQGLSVLLTGETLPPRTVTGTTVNPNLNVSPGIVTFQNAVAVTGVSGATQTVTVTNTGATAFALTLGLTGDFTQTTSCGATLGGGQSCAVVVGFAPSQPGARQGLLAVTAGAGFSPTYVTLGGTGAAILPANNGTLDLGSTAVGQPVTQFYKVPVPFAALTVTATGPYTVVLVEDVGFGHGQPPGSAYAATVTGACRNCFVGVQFLPTAAGVQAGSLTISSVAGGAAYALALTGVGVPVTGVLVSPVMQDFGTVAVHSVSGMMTFTVTNLVASGGSVTLGTAGVTGDFALRGTTCGATLGYGASCAVGVAFAPAAVGVRTGTLTVGGTTVGLTGTAGADTGVGINPTALTFSNVPGSAATQQTVTVTNTGAATVSVGVPTVATGSFKVASGCGTLAAGASCSIGVTFVAGTATVVDSLAIPVTNTVGPPVTVSYSVALNGAYTAGAGGLQIVPGQAQFGPVAVGTEAATRVFTVNNLTAKSLTLNVGIPRQFVLVGAPCAGLAPNASCSFGAAFLPLTHGDIPGTITAQGVPSDGTPAVATLGYVEGFGTSAGTLGLTGGLIVNGVYSFGQVTSGQTAVQVFTLTNRGAAGSDPVTVRRVTSGPPFLATTNCGTALAVGQSCTVTVTYAPLNQVANGTVSPPATPDAGALTIESDAATSPDVLNLSGTAGPVAVNSPSNAGPLATFTLSSSSLTFGTVTVGNASAAQAVTLANTGTVTIHVGTVFATADFTVQNGCGTVVAGASCTLLVLATPQTAGVKVASLEIATDGATALEFVSLIGTGAPSPLTLSPAALDFGALIVGQSQTLPVLVTNTTATGVVFQSVTATGDYRVGGTCPAAGGVLAANASCTVQVTFTPTAAGTRTGTLALATSASANTLTVPLTGVGTQSALLVSPSSLAFGSIAVGSPASLSVTLTNNGTAPVMNLAVTATGDYAVTVPCPQVLGNGASCVMQVTFTPTALGPRAGSLRITSSDPGSPVTVPLTGTGVQGGSFTLTVDGGASSSVTVQSGQPATYHLAITPVGGFNGTVALTCAPVIAAQFASCSLLPSSVALAGAQTSVVTINTITSIGGNALLRGALGRTLVCLLVPGLWALRRRRRWFMTMVMTGAMLVTVGCGGSGDFNTRYTPPGVYQYQVTGSSTNGIQVTQTVVLNLTVTGR